MTAADIIHALRGGKTAEGIRLVRMLVQKHRPPSDEGMHRFFRTLVDTVSTGQWTTNSHLALEDRSTLRFTKRQDENLLKDLPVFRMERRLVESQPKDEFRLSCRRIDYVIIELHQKYRSRVDYRCVAVPEWQTQEIFSFDLKVYSRCVLYGIANPVHLECGTVVKYLPQRQEVYPCSVCAYDTWVRLQKFFVYPSRENTLAVRGTDVEQFEEWSNCERILVTRDLNNHGDVDWERVHSALGRYAEQTYMLAERDYHVQNRIVQEEFLFLPPELTGIITDYLIPPHDEMLSYGGSLPSPNWNGEDRTIAHPAVSEPLQRYHDMFLHQLSVGSRLQCLHAFWDFYKLVIPASPRKIPLSFMLKFAGCSVQATHSMPLDSDLFLRYDAAECTSKTLVVLVPDSIRDLFSIGNSGSIQHLRGGQKMYLEVGDVVDFVYILKGPAVQLPSVSLQNKVNAGCKCICLHGSPRWIRIFLKYSHLFKNPDSHVSFSKWDMEWFQNVLERFITGIAKDDCGQSPIRQIAVWNRFVTYLYAKCTVK